MRIILTIILITLLNNSFGQNDIKEKVYSEYNGNVSELKICYDCDMEIMLKKIKKHISEYPLDNNKEYIKSKGDTLIEIISFDDHDKLIYSYFENNLLKINYIQTDSENFILTVMDNFELEQKKWLIHPNEKHIIDFDDNNRMQSYFAEIYDGNEKVEFMKLWINGKYKSGFSKIYILNDKKWILKKENKITSTDWPVSKHQEIKKYSIQSIPLLHQINSAHFISSFNFPSKYIEENNDTTESFLPFRLKSGLATGTYRIYKKVSSDWKTKGLLIDANIVKGLLEGVYNEYDLKTEKLKIYCIYKNGKIDGRRTIYVYDKKGKMQGKYTELWSNGKYIGRIH